MFLPHNQTLLTNLATGGNLVLKKADGSRQDFDEYRISPNAHVMFVDDVRYTAPTDFTLSSDGDGDVTLHWLNATTLVTGKILRLGVAYIDLIVAGMATSAGGGGGGDATAANQATANATLAAIQALLNTQAGYLDGLETAIAATNTLLTTQNTYLDGVETAIAATNTAVGSTNTLLTTQNGYLDGVEALLGTTNTNIASTNTLLTTQAGYLDQVETKLDTVNTSINATAPSAVFGDAKYVDVVFSVDTAIYAAGDVLADTQQVAGAFSVNDAVGLFASAVFTCETDLAPEFTCYIFGAANSMGTENAAPSITDANARQILGSFSIVAADWKDLGGVRFAKPSATNFQPFGVRAVSGTPDLHVALVLDTGTPTFAVNDMRGHFYVQRG